MCLRCAGGSDFKEYSLVYLLILNKPLQSESMRSQVFQEKPHGDGRERRGHNTGWWGNRWRGWRWWKEPQGFQWVFTPTFLFHCSDLLLLNGQVIALFHCGNPFHYLFLSKREKLSVLKWPYSIWLGESHCPSV